MRELALPEGLRFKALLFDMDGTLSDTDGLHRQAMVETLAAQGVSLSDADFHRHVSGQSNENIFGHFFPGLSVDAQRRLADEKEALYRRLTPQMSPMPGLLPLIAWAKGQGVVCALVTNGPRLNVEHTLRVLGLADSFDARVLGEELPRAKPDPLPYQDALRRLGVEASEAVAFEDSVPGISSALAAGVATVEITGPARKVGLHPGADLTVSDFAAPSLLRWLRPAASQRIA
ncbi:HAD family phosphatase [Asticcacaulis sp. AND118]|uniref:HAD family hydrolase n=1 Tax=Asticcacaulis sp. AND118 TaxID=2840468 RepID=UPI001CFFCA77|nr:HAD family phosphatase [Asticcacaulis sp. AND118]UDF03041.1 HAD family phosphatase [Asticcacaulis sp. AND118]